MSGQSEQEVGDLAVNVVGFPAGAVMGFLVSLYARFTADAAVRVRPNLADVGFIDATVTNHGHDWLFYHYPTAMSIFTVLFAVFVIGFGWKWCVVQ